jgi:hypothetical protein
VAGAPGGWVPVAAEVLDAGAEDVPVLGAADSLGAGEGVGVAGLGDVRPGRADGDWPRDVLVLVLVPVPGVVAGRRLAWFSTALPMVVPEPARCQMRVSSGFPAMASTAVTALIAITNAPSTAPAMTTHRRRPCWPGS